MKLYVNDLCETKVRVKPIISANLSLLLTRSVFTESGASIPLSSCCKMHMVHVLGKQNGLQQEKKKTWNSRENAELRDSFTDCFYDTFFHIHFLLNQEKHVLLRNNCDQHVWGESPMNSYSERYSRSN